MRQMEWRRLMRLNVDIAQTSNEEYYAIANLTGGITISLYSHCDSNQDTGFETNTYNI